MTEQTKETQIDQTLKKMLGDDDLKVLNTNHFAYSSGYRSRKVSVQLPNDVKLSIEFDWQAPKDEPLGIGA